MKHKVILLLGMITMLWGFNFVSAQCINSGQIDWNNLSTSSGNVSVDNLIKYHSSVLSNYTGVSPRVRYSHVDIFNAYAKANYPTGTDGTICITQEMIDDCKKIDPIAVVAVLAHEYGHLFCAKHQLQGLISDKNEELFCDFVAGYYIALAMAKRSDFQSVKDLIDTQMYIVESQGRFGDNDFSSSDHHGTPKERKAAMMAYMPILWKMNNLGYHAPNRYFTNGRWYTGFELALIEGFNKMRREGELKW